MGQADALAAEMAWPEPSLLERPLPLCLGTQAEPEPRPHHLSPSCPFLSIHSPYLSPPCPAYPLLLPTLHSPPSTLPVSLVHLSTCPPANPPPSMEV